MEANETNLEQEQAQEQKSELKEETKLELKEETKSELKEETKSKIELEEIEDFFKCDVCKEVFNDPRTLLCQHTFCNSCLVSLKDCPMCRLKIYLPTDNNNIFNDLIGVVYGAEKVKEFQMKHQKDKLEKEMLPKVLEELNNNINNTIKNSSPPSRQQSSTSISSNIINDNSNEVISFWGFSIKLSTFENIIKFFEIGFLLYYLYSFFINYTNGNLSTYKIFLNLLIIFQSFYSIFASSSTHSSMLSF
jgi:hypothetical protein